MKKHAKFIILGLEIGQMGTSKQLSQLMERTFFVVASHAKMCRLRELEKELKDKELVFGKNSLDLLPIAIHDGVSLKTSQGFLLKDLQPSSMTWPQSGMMQNGKVYQRRRLVPRTSEIGFGLWPTPMAGDFTTSRAHQKPNNIRSPSLRPLMRRFGLKPNPLFVEWMMGYGENHTAINLDY